MRLVVALALATLAGCKSTADIIAEGDALRREKRLDEALDKYREAQERSDIGGTEKQSVARARGEILLEKGDLNGAEQSIRRMPESSGARAALLAKVFLARGDRAQAEIFERQAYEKREPGAAATLAELVGGEATTPDRLREAAAILRDGGVSADQAKAAETVADLWQSAVRGEPAQALLPRLESVRAQAPRYASVELARCDLLARAGDPRADEAYTALAAFVPRPSAEFQKRASEQHAAQAARTGNVSELESALKGLSREEAGQKRADMARALEGAGDVKGALDLWKKTADAGGAPAARAQCEIARIEESRGRHAEATAALEKARAATELDPETRALLALERARQDDPLGARKALEDAGEDTKLAPGLRSECARVGRATAFLGRALDALARGEDASGFARAAIAAASEVRLAASVVEAAEAPRPEAGKEPPAPVLVALDGSAGDTRAAIVRADVGLLCAVAAFEDAVKLAATDADATLAAVTELAPGAIARLLEVGRVEDAVKLFKALKEKNLIARATELTGRVRADATFGALWLRDGFVGSVGRPDPLARRAPYVCSLVLRDGESFGVVRVSAVSAEGLEVELPGKVTVKVPRERLSELSQRGLPDAAFEAACETAAAAEGR